MSRNRHTEAVFLPMGPGPSAPAEETPRSPRRASTVTVYARSPVEVWSRLNSCPDSSSEHRLSDLLGTDGASTTIRDLNRRACEVNDGRPLITQADIGVWAEVKAVPVPWRPLVDDAWVAKNGEFDTDEEVDLVGQVEAMRAAGKSNVEIGAELGITPQAVSKRISNEARKRARAQVPGEG